MNNEERDIREDTHINKFKLEDENAQQSSIIYYWSEKLSEAKKELDDCEVQLKVIRSEKELHYRTYPIDGQKVTESSVKAMVEIDVDVGNLEKKKNRIKYEVNILSGAVNSMEHKKSALKNLTELWIKNYYSSPDNFRSGVDDKQDAIREKINQK